MKYFKSYFKTDLSYLLSLVFVSLSLVFVHVFFFFCFDLLFLLVLEFMPSSRIYSFAMLGMLFAWHCQMLVFYRWSCLCC